MSVGGRPATYGTSVITGPTDGDGASADPDVWHALIRSRLDEEAGIIRSLVDGPAVAATAEVARRIAAALRMGGKVLFFGNGGSAMEAGHLAAELLGRYRLERTGLAAISLSDATAAVTAIANDYDYADVFARQIVALGRPGDVAVGLTTSGMSENVRRGLVAARTLEMYAVAMTGANGGQVAAVADSCVCVPSVDTARVQEAHLILGHTICEIAERELFADLE
jgi:D-sedoheptulose 7-phosphate isomerase